MARRPVLIVLIVLVGALLAGALFLWKGSALSAPPGPAMSTPESAPGSELAAVPTPAAPTAPASKVRKLSPEQRKQLGAQIAAAVHQAREARAARARSAGTPVSDDDPVIPLEAVGPELEHALTAAIPLLAQCYEHAGSAASRTAAAQMTMTSDPDLGTVIDTGDIVDATGHALDHTLDDCLRDTIDALALPPLGQPGKLQLQYSFRFD
ncbi:MAG: hypothetical protein ABI467_02110 [Kofleriaceae bacterium]